MLRRQLATLLLAGALAAPAAAADDGSRYSEWRPDDAGASGTAALEALARELEALIDEADRARAADPRFLQDLRDRIAAHVADARPREALIRDDFTDGDYTDDPRWTVGSGDFSVDPVLGLRTMVALPEAGWSLTEDAIDTIIETGDALLESGDELLESSDELLESGKEAIDDLLSGETKLGDLFESDEEEVVTEDTGADGPEPAEITLEAAIPNAFLLEMEMTSRIAGEGAQLEIDLFQGRGGSAGYRLSYLPGARPALVLSRFNRRGVTVIGEHGGRLGLEDGASHMIALSRESDGTMTASVDGTPLVRVKSSALDDPFDGVSLVNGGGDYAIRSIAVYGDE